jgi:DNA-binding CsgD family transcriptional regulator
MNRLEPATTTLERVMRNQDTVTRLTDNQIDLLIRVALGKTNAQIADDLCLQEQTIKNRVTRLMKKLHADNRVHIATLACLGYPPSETQLRVRWRDLNKETALSATQNHIVSNNTLNIRPAAQY